ENDRSIVFKTRDDDAQKSLPFEFGVKLVGGIVLDVRQLDKERRGQEAGQNVHLLARGGFGLELQRAHGDVRHAEARRLVAQQSLESDEQISDLLNFADLTVQ